MGLPYPALDALGVGRGRLAGLLGETRRQDGFPWSGCRDAPRYAQKHERNLMLHGASLTRGRVRRKHEIAWMGHAPRTRAWTRPGASLLFVDMAVAHRGDPETHVSPAPALVRLSVTGSTASGASDRRAACRRSDATTGASVVRVAGAASRVRSSPGCPPLGGGALRDRSQRGTAQRRDTWSRSARPRRTYRLPRGRRQWNRCPCKPPRRATTGSLLQWPIHARSIHRASPHEEGKRDDRDPPSARRSSTARDWRAPDELRFIASACC